MLWARLHFLFIELLPSRKVFPPGGLARGALYKREVGNDPNHDNYESDSGEARGIVTNTSIHDQENSERERLYKLYFLSGSGKHGCI